MTRFARKVRGAMHPLPPFPWIDVAIIANFGLALTILLMTLYVTRPIDFSTFPSLLLVVTLLRLSINVAATRLILAGQPVADDVLQRVQHHHAQGVFGPSLVGEEAFGGCFFCHHAVLLGRNIGRVR